MGEKNNKEIYNDFLNSYIEDLQDEYEYESFYIYGPLTEKYWEHNPRILICNLEPYDGREGETTVDINLFKEWIKSKTGKTTAILIAQLFQRLNKKNNTISKYFNNQELLSFMENVAYMNFRVTSGKRTNADIRGINDDVNNLRGYIIDQINKIVPQIIIIGGKEGCNIFNKLFNSDLNFKETKKINNWIVCSLTHPSRLSIKDRDQAINQILEF